jgi:hypothetical protein
VVETLPTGQRNACDREAVAATLVPSALKPANCEAVAPVGSGTACSRGNWHWAPVKPRLQRNPQSPVELQVGAAFPLGAVQTWQVPALPQAAGVSVVMHTLLLQQPMGHEVELHTH